MTTLQELEKAFDETIEYSTLLLSTNGDSSMLSENIKDINLIKSFIEKSYLAGKEDEKKRVVEIVKKVQAVEKESNGRYNACNEIIQSLNNL
jgi:CRISPR/Cas system CSM-associated protein Csm4 (group 5 of RAMP superfamily)